MSQHNVSLSEYRGMWLFTLFDLPNATKDERRDYTRFRKHLLREGFAMLQYSVYARYFGCEDACDIHRKRIEAHLPPNGQVRLLAVTDMQFGKMQVFYGKSKHPTEEPPKQLLLF